MDLETLPPQTPSDAKISFNSFKRSNHEELISKVSYCKDLLDSEVQVNLVLPGDLITDERGFIQGGGTYEENEKIYSSMIGHVIRTNKLISVAPLKNRYKGIIGDLVVGRVKEVISLF
jgi:hypothetical protein